MTDRLGIVVISIGLLIGAAIPLVAWAGNTKVYLFIPFVMISLLVAFLRPAWALWFIGVWIHFQHLLTHDLGLIPRAGTWLDEGILLLLLIRMIFVVIRRNKWFRTPVEPLFWAFLSLGIVSSLANRVQPVHAVLGLRSLLQYIVFFYIVLNSGFKEIDLKIFVQILFTIVLLQVPVAFAQFLRTRSAFEPDRVYGTLALGWGNHLGLYLAAFVCLFLGIYRITKTRRYLIASLLSGFGMVLTSSRAALWFLLPCLLFMFGRELLARPALFARVISILVVIAVSIGVYYAEKPGGLEAGLQEIKPDQLFREQMDIYYSPGRIRYLIIGWELLWTEAASPLIGVGPSRFSSGAGDYLRAPLLERVTYGAYSTKIPSQIVAIGVEYGMLGLIIAVGMYFVLIVQNEWLFRSLSDPFWKGIALGMRGLLILALLGAWTENIWEVQPFAYIPWFFASATFLKNSFKERGH